MNSNRQRTVATILGLAGMLGLVAQAGCSKPSMAQFKPNERTAKLIAPAAGKIKQVIADNFGTPDTLVAWAKFPVAYGGYEGRIKGINSPTALAIEWQGEAPTGPIANRSLVWLSGAKRTNGEDRVARYESAGEKLEFTAIGSSAEVAVGDRMLVDAGKTLAFGKKVYQRNCMHCHGTTGDGQGPTAPYLNPLPRDFRNGVFKFTSTHSGEKATREDLRQLLANGIPGTYMPSFLLLGEDETTAVIEYVRWLAMRGEYEKRLIDELADFTIDGVNESIKKSEEKQAEAIAAGEKPEEPVLTSETALAKASESFAGFVKDDLPDLEEETADFVASLWKRGEDSGSLVVPISERVNDDEASRERGRLLYLSDKTKCYTCHGITGRGDGSSQDQYWAKPGSDEKYAVKGLHDSWGNPIPPRDLTKGQYRGGRRPIDLYRRLYAGIKGTPMPAFGGTVLQEQDLWDVVNYVMSVQYTANQRNVTASIKP